MNSVRPKESMPGRGSIAAAATLTAEEFAARFHERARVLWTIAAGVLGDPSEAEDVLQEACLMALGKLEQFDPETRFTAWMGRFVRNVALNHRRKAGRRATRTTDPEALAELSSSGGPRGPGHPGIPPVNGRGDLARDQLAFDDRVLAGLNELSDTQRACLLLRTVLDLSYREVARALEIPEGTAMSHVHRARQALREKLS